MRTEGELVMTKATLNSVDCVSFSWLASKLHVSPRDCGSSGSWLMYC